jgi:hypothetical protein
MTCARVLLSVLCALPLAASSAPAVPDTDLDQFMARVLARRDDNWRKLQQYVLDERETAELLGPGRARMYGLAREYTWYIRDGVFVRSPVKFDGVELSEAERRKYEDEWLQREKQRAQKDAAPAAAPAQPDGGDVDALMRLTKEPQFVSAAYFLKFKFEQGHYAFAGPDTVAGQKVLKIEYYPERLFADDKKGDDGKDKEKDKDVDSKTEARLERQFNKVALVTLWIAPDSHQIVKYVFDNIGMDFLPGRSLVRVEDVQATMEMAQPFPDVWLPAAIDGRGGVTLANGTFEVRYAVRYHDYREATVKVKLR